MADEDTNKRRVVIIAVLLLVVFAAVVGIRYLWNSGQEETYEKAVAALRRGDREEAMDLFSSIGDYRDAETQVLLIQIEKARQLGVIGK